MSNVIDFDNTIYLSGRIGEPKILSSSINRNTSILTKNIYSSLILFFDIMHMEDSNSNSIRIMLHRTIQKYTECYDMLFSGGWISRFTQQLPGYFNGSISHSSISHSRQACV